MFGNKGKAHAQLFCMLKYRRVCSIGNLIVIRDHSDDLNQLWGRIHGFRWCINPQRTRGSQLGQEKQRDESVKARRNVRKSFLLPLVIQNFRRAFPAKLTFFDCPWVYLFPRSPPHWKARRPWGGGCQHGENKTKHFVGTCSSKKMWLEIVCNVGFKVSKSKLYLNEVRLLC